MGRIFIPAMLTPGTAPLVLCPQYDTGQTFIKGALLVFNGSGLVVECGADPTLVAGVAGQAVNTSYGYDAANSPVPVTGREPVVSMCVANSTTIFSGRMINGGTDPVTPALTDIGVNYGVAKTAAGEWVVDQADTTHDVVIIVKVDITNKFVYFKFLPAVLNLG